MTSERHPIAQIHAWHDGRLPDDERSAVSAHLEGCAACRSELEGLRALDAGLRQLEQPQPPPGLEATLRTGLDREDARRTGQRRMRWLLGAATVGAMLVLAAVLARRGHEPDWPALAAAAHSELERGVLRLDVEESGPQALEQKLRAQGATVRVLDLAMMGFQLVGGSVREVDRHRIALVAYRNAEGRILLCEMFPGGDVRLPPPLEERRSGGIVFSVYDRVGRTAVFWREGEVLCALVSGGPRDEVVALAIAKAKVPDARRR
jgi:anti-sigma factor RsiW